MKMYCVLVRERRNMAAAKRRDLHLSDKVDILKQLESPGVTQASLAKRFGVSTSQVWHIVKFKGEILKQFDNGGNHEQKCQRSCKEEDVGSALFLWFQQKVAQGARLSGPLLKQKATELASAKGTEFTTSDGWLSRWKIRHNVVYKKNKEKNRMQTWEQLVIGKMTFLMQMKLLFIIADYLTKDIVRKDSILLEGRKPWTG